MKRIISLLVVMAMMLATVLAVIPVSATASTDNSDVPVTDVEESAETTRFLPEGAYEALKAEFEGTAASNKFENSVTPFAFNQLEAQEKFSGKQILNITLPIKIVGSKFTISVYDIDDLMKASSPVEIYEIAVDTSAVTAGKFATLDLTSYNIKVGAGETLAFGSATDTLLPAWYGSTSSLRSVAEAKAPFTTGIIGNTGKANAVSQPGNSIFMDVEMRDLTEDELKTSKFMSSAVYNMLSKAFEEGAFTNKFVNDVTPFAFAKTEAQERFSNKRLVNITLPIKVVGDKFTITVLDMEDVTIKSTPVATYEITVDPATLTAGKSATIDLTSYNIKVGPGETLAFGSATDTLLPAWYPGESTTMVSIADTYAAYTRGIYGWAGTKNDNEVQPGNTIFLNAEMVELSEDEAFGTKVSTEAELAAMKAGHNYYLADNLTLSAEWESKALDGVIFNGNGKTITLTGTNGLFGDVVNSTVGNFTLTGDVTTTTGVSANPNNATYRNITVNLKKIEGDVVGALAAEVKGNVTIYNCVNNTPVKGTDASGAIGASHLSGAVIKVDKFVNNGAIDGSARTGGAVMGWLNANATFIIRNSVNAANVVGSYGGGFIGAAYGNGVEIYDSVNGIKDAETQVVISGGGGDGVGGFAGAVRGIKLEGCVNYANVIGPGNKSAGGFLGEYQAATATITNCDNYGNVVNSGGNHAGGFIGNARTGGTSVVLNDVNNYGVIEAKDAAGAIIGYSVANVKLTKGTNTANITGGANGAGVIGKCGGGAGAPISVDGFVNSGNLKGGTTSGAIIGWSNGGGSVEVKNSENKGNSNASYASGFIGALQISERTASFSNCKNGGTVTGGSYTGGFIGEYNGSGSLTMTNCTNNANLTGPGKIGGLFADKSGNGELTLTDCTNNGSVTLTGTNNMGGIAGRAFASKATLTRVYNKGNVTKTGGNWNAGNGGIFGCTNNGTYYFNDCGNYGAVTGGSDNKGGFIGYYEGSKVYIVNGVNTGDIAGTGNNGGFLGQAGGGTMYYENCVNTGNISSSNNTAGGIQGWGGVSSVTAVNVVNKGDITAKADTKWAAGLFTSPDGASVLLSGCANYGIVTGNSFAAGLVADGATNIAAENCFNAGKVDAKSVYEISNKKYTTTACIITGLHADLLAEAAKLETYAELVEKDEWQAVVDAFAGAKAVYDNAESTAADKIAAVDVIKAAVKDTKAYLLTNTTTLSTKDPSIVINYRLDGAKKTDYIAFVKDGATEATITVLLQDITDNFDLFTAEAAEGKTITEGNYKLYLVSKDVALADVIADPEKAYDVVEILVAANVIMNAEDFMAIAGTDGEYILANDIAVEGGIEFSGKLNGRGNTITLTGNKGLFSKLNGATITNLKIAAASTETVVAYGLADVVTGDVTIDGVTVGTLTISNGDKAGSFINAAEDAESDIVIKNSVTSAAVSGTNYAGGLIGLATVKTVTIENVKNNGVTVTMNNNANGAGGFIGQATGNVTVKNSINNAKVVATNGSRGGIIGQYGKNGDVFTAIGTTNNGTVEGNNGWPTGAGGFIGATLASVSASFTDCENNGNLTKAATNKGGFIGYTRGDKSLNTVTYLRCTNNGNVYSPSSNVGGFHGQVPVGTLSFTDCVNNGNITSGAEDGKNGLWAAGFCGQYGGNAVLLRCENNGTITVYHSARKGNSGNVWDGDGGAGGLNGAGVKSMTDCVNNGAVISDSRAGGIVGHTGSATFTRVTNNHAVVGGNRTGGIIGSADGTFTMSDVKNLASVTASSGIAAGLIGKAFGTYTIQNSQNGSADAIDGIVISGAGDTWASNNNSNGGIFGYVQGTVNLTNVANYAKIAPTAAVSSGGIIGMFANSDTVNSTFNGNKVYNYGTVVAMGYSEGTAGMIGNAKWVGTTDITFIDSENHGDITGESNTAGFLGWGDGNQLHTFTRCKNFGDITVKHGSDERYAAGFVAATNTACVFEDCENYGTILSIGPNANSAGVIGKGGNSETVTGFVNEGTIISDAVAAGVAVAGAENASISGAENKGILISNTGATYAFTNGNVGTIENSTAEDIVVINPNDETTFVEIWTAEDFMSIKKEGFYVIMDDIVLPTDYESIDFGGNVIVPVIKGNGHTIYMKGLTCPLFNNLASAEISDLTLVGYIEGEKATAALANKIAAEVQPNTVYDITLNNIVVDVDITNESGVSVAGFIATSGIVGSKITNLTINDSKFLGNIESTGYAAGFVAYFDTYGEVELNNCVVGDIGLNTTIKGTGRVAAFFAKIRSSADPATTTVTATLTDCVNYATITQVTTGAEGVTGGIIGRVQRITLVLDGVENYGDVTSTRPGLTWYAGVGGLVGEANSNATLTILSSTNYGDVYTDKYYTGGLVGALTNSSKLTVGAIDDQGNVSEGSANYGKVWNGSGWNYGLGGILGGSAWNTKGVGTTDYASEIRIYDTVNYGEVTTKGGANLGGMMGMTDANPALVEVVGCENHGYIHVGGNNRLGGILGQVNATTISIRNTTNYGDVSANNAFNNNDAINALPTDAEKDFHIDTCHTAGIRPEHYAAAGTVEIINCVNYGTIGSATTKTSAAGITVRVDATTAKVEGCVNYGTIIGPLSTSGVCALPQGEQVKNCANYGLVVNANGSQVAPGADMSNKAYGAVVTDKDLVEIAKKVNASDYKLNDLIGKELTFAVPVDLASQLYVGQAGKDVKGNFEYYYELALDAEKNTLGAMVYDDPTTAIIEVAYAVPAMTYATKLATITNESYFEITLDAKNNTAGTNSGFVYAIAADGTVYSVARDLDAEAAAEGYGQYKVVYDGLVVTVYVMANGDWTQLGDAVTVAAGTSVAVGIANGASDFTYDDETGDVLGTPAQNQNTATIANVTFKTTYRAGGIVNAFKEIDAVAQELAEADALAAALKVALDEAQAIHDAAKKTEDEAAEAVDVASKALAEAALAGKQGADLDPYEKDLADKIAVYERAHQDHTHSEYALDTEKASYEAAKAEADALAASNADDVAAAKAAVDTAIESALNYAAYNDAVVAKAAMGAKFNAKYAKADRDAYNAAAAKALAATTQADLDAAVEAMSEILNAIDWSAYNYWVDIAESLEENDWTILTWATYKEFLATLDEADKSTQEAVDKLTADIIAAIDALKHDIELADEMQTYITAELEERGWIEENYTPRSWKPFYATVIKPFQDAIDANKAAKSADVETTEQTLRAAYELFNDETEVTYTDLVYIADLKEILDLAAQITDDTTDEGEKTFSEISELYFLLAIPKAEIAYEDAMNEETENADAKQIIADAIAAIEPAYKGLVDVTELNTAIAGYKAEVADKVYTAETWNEFALALSKAEFLAVTAKTAEEIEAAMAALEAAYDALVVLEAIDLDALNEALEAAKKLNEDDYTKASWNALEDAIVDAKIASFSDNQAMIDEAYKALSDALTALVPMPSTESLETLIAEVETLNADEYTAKTWLVLVTALQSAKSALNSESKEVVEEATDALAAAKAELVKKAAADTTALEALIAEIEALKADDYTAETWANVKTALDAAKAALESDEQTVVDVAKAALDAAKANLDKVVVVVETEEEEEEEDEAPVQSSTETTEKKGCKSAIGATVVVMTAVLGLGATVVLKKKEN